MTPNIIRKRKLNVSLIRAFVARLKSVVIPSIGTPVETTGVLEFEPFLFDYQTNCIRYG